MAEPFSVPRDASRWAEVDLAALRDNVRRIGARVGASRYVCVAKADGYGHGAGQCVAAAMAGGAWGAAVSTLPEAASLRSHGFRGPLLVFGPVYAGEESLAAVLGCAVTVFDSTTIRRLERAAHASGRPMPVHLKVDTGMSRLGCPPDAALALARQVERSEWLQLQGVYTHFASADCDRAATDAQLTLFESVRARLETAGHRAELYHAANSAAALSLPESRLDAVRVGIATYGMTPFGEDATEPGLTPVLSWRTRVAQVKDLPVGAQVGYGGAFTALRPMRVATCTVGYADGYFRSQSNQGQVLVRGRRCGVVGRVSMDLITVDCEAVPDVEPGDVVTLLGTDGAESVSAWEVARRAGTIAWEVTCALSPRVPRLYRT
ncbi:MAG: alanine racemase [Candidatus Dormibacteria bacterium]